MKRSRKDSERKAGVLGTPVLILSFYNSLSHIVYIHIQIISYINKLTSI